MDSALIITRIEDLLRNNNINGVELGRLLGKAKSPLTDWRNGQSIPTLKQIYEICEYLAVSADYVLFGISETQGPINKVYSQLDERGRQAVMGVALSELTRMENMLRLAEQSEGNRDNRMIHSHPSQAPPMKQKKGAPKAGATGEKKVK